MSAIFGLLDFSGGVDISHISKRMSTALERHGPEQGSSWGDSGIVLGHRLLAFTPEDRFGESIEHSECGRYVLVAEGRIDNRAELIALLSLKAQDVKRWPDSRFMLKAFERWGRLAGAYLYGGFCFAVWDRSASTLFLTRDPLGYHHTLFYTQTSQFFAFSTAIKGLLSLPGVPRALNHEKLADFLILNHNNHQSTHYEDVLRLPPAHFLEIGVTSKALKLRQYWKPDLEKRIRYVKDHEYVDAFKELFDRCVADSLRSISPVAVSMSGGVDSSAVATTAAMLLKKSGKKLQTYTAVPHKNFKVKSYPSSYDDETPLVQDILKLHDNIESHLITAEGISPLDNLSPFFDAQEAPFRNPCNRVWIEEISREAGRRGQRVLLNGQMGNMTLSWGGEDALPDWFRRGKLIQFSSGLAALAGYRNKSLYRYFKAAVARSLPDPVWRFYRQIRHGIPRNLIPEYSGIRPSFAKSQRVLERAAQAGFSTSFRSPPGGREARWNVLSGADFSGDLAAGSRAQFGIDLRDPTGDRRLVEFCLAIPQEQFLGGGSHRWLAKRALADRLPLSVLNNDLLGHQDPGWYERMEIIQQEMHDVLTPSPRYPDKERMLNLKHLHFLLDHWPGEGADWRTPALVRDYRLCLLRSVMVGAFIEWFVDNK